MKSLNSEASMHPRRMSDALKWCRYSWFRVRIMYCGSLGSMSRPHRAAVVTGAYLIKNWGQKAMRDSWGSASNVTFVD